MSNTFSNTRNYSGGSSYSSSSTNEINWSVIIIIFFVFGGGCAAIIEDASGFWAGLIVSGFVLITNLNN